MSTTYTPASHKPDKLLTGFISVRVPEIKYIYGSLQGSTSVTEVTAKFGRPSDDGTQKNSHVEECLRFLNAVDLVESPTGDIRAIVEPINDRLLDGLSFEARLLYHCNQQEGRQTHFTAVHRALLSEGSRTVAAGRDNLRTIVKRETDYEFSWTDEKLDMWVTMCEQVGLVSGTVDGLILSPCRALLHDALLLAPISDEGGVTYHGDPVEDAELQRALNWIEDNMFSVYETRTGKPRVHPAVADVLRNMEEDGVLSLSAPGDAQNPVAIPPADINNDTRGNRREATYFSIQWRPDETAYEYPLNQHLTHQ